MTGGCLCGRLRYDITGELGKAIHCHCPMCRKAQGVAFTTNAVVKRDDFRWVVDTDSLREFESSPGKFRCFCGHCGSPIYKYDTSNPGVLRLRVGSLDDGAMVDVVAHIHVSSKAPWFMISDKTPQYMTTVTEDKRVNENK